MEVGVGMRMRQWTGGGRSGSWSGLGRRWSGSDGGWGGSRESTRGEGSGGGKTVLGQTGTRVGSLRDLPGYTLVTELGVSRLSSVQVNYQDSPPNSR